MVFFISVVAVFLAVGLIAPVLISIFYERKPVNPYLPALIVWSMGFLFYADYKIKSLIHNTGGDPIGQTLVLYVMLIAVISSVVSWAIAELWTRKKGISRLKIRKAVMILNISTIVMLLFYPFITGIVLFINEMIGQGAIHLY